MAVEPFPLPRPTHDAWTVDDLDLFPESSRIEVLDGALIVNPPPTTRHSHVQVQVVLWLETYRHRHGWTILTEPGVRIGESGVIPDVALVSVPGDDTIWLDPEDVEIVVEVLSPSTRNRDLGRKRELYAAAELTYVIVDPEERSIEVLNDEFDLDVTALAVRLHWLH